MIFANGLNNDAEFFQFLNSFSNLDTLVTNNFQTVPDLAFGNVQNNLREVALVSSNLVSVGRRAFFGLNALTHLSLGETESSNTQLRIHPEAFEFSQASTDTLQVRFGNLTLAQDFLVGVNLTQFKRPVKFDLEFIRGVSFLDQATFQPFFQANLGNEIDFGAVHVNPAFPDCSDCRNSWFVEQELLNTRVKQTIYAGEIPEPLTQVQCGTNGRMVDMSTQDFEACKNDDRDDNDDNDDNSDDNDNGQKGGSNKNTVAAYSVMMWCVFLLNVFYTL